MKYLIPVLAVAGLVVGACQDRPDPAPGEPAAAQAETEDEMASEGTSIMRPDVIAEAEPEAPLPEPVEARVLFGVGETALSNESKAVLDALIAGNRLTRDHWFITLTGRTDATGDAETNRQLAHDRTVAVRAYLVEKGVRADRITMVAAGEPGPGGDPSIAASPMENRRVDIRGEARREP